MAKKLTNKDKVIAAMKEAGGPVTIDALVPVCKMKRKQIYRVIHEQLMLDSTAVKNEDTGEYWLTDPEGIVEKGGTTVKQEKDTQDNPGGEDIGKSGSLDQSTLFSDQLKAVGVRADVVPTITQLFFSGDINDLNWLKEVLHKQAAGWVSPHQENLILSWWASTRKLPYTDDLFVKIGKGEPVKSDKQPPAEETNVMDPGMGWDVKKQGSDWIPVPGGPIATYKEAADRAEKRQMMEMYGRQQGQPTSGAPAAEVRGDSVPIGAGPAKPPDFMDKFMDKMLDVFFTGGSIGGDKGDSVLVAQIQQLNERIQTLQENAREERMQRLEGMVVQALNRDPFDEYQRIQKMKQQLGVQEGTVITDQSPAVQLMRDASDKFERTSNRLLGVMERVMLKSDQFNPEETRTPEERDAVATRLLHEVGDRENVKQLRDITFGGI